MFVVVTLTDNVRVLPQDHGLPRGKALIQELNAKYANKVLANTGLCIRVLDILQASEGTIFACQDGSYTCQTAFRLIVFRPFIGEVISGRVLSQSPLGIRVSLGFFDDITIPHLWMKQPDGACEFNVSEGVWVWKIESDDVEDQETGGEEAEDEEGGPSQLFIDNGEKIRFRVESETFADVAPRGKVQDTKQPYSLAGSITDDGLGLESWWE